MRASAFCAHMCAGAKNKYVMSCGEEFRHLEKKIHCVSSFLMAKTMGTDWARVTKTVFFLVI